MSACSNGGAGSQPSYGPSRYDPSPGEKVCLMYNQASGRSPSVVLHVSLGFEGMI